MYSLSPSFFSLVLSHTHKTNEKNMTLKVQGWKQIFLGVLNTKLFWDYRNCFCPQKCKLSQSSNSNLYQQLWDLVLMPLKFLNLEISSQKKVPKKLCLTISLQKQVSVYYFLKIFRNFFQRNIILIYLSLINSCH